MYSHSALRHRQHDARTEKRLEWQLADAGSALGQVDGRVQVRAVVHRGDDALREHP